MTAIYSKHLLGDDLASIILPEDILQVVVGQLVAAYHAENHSMAAAVVHAAQDLANLAQGSKALHTTAMAAWHHLSEIVQDPKHCLSRYYKPLPDVEHLNWVSPVKATQVWLRQRHNVSPAYMSWLWARMLCATTSRALIY